MSLTLCPILCISVFLLCFHLRLSSVSHLNPTSTLRKHCSRRRYTELPFSYPCLPYILLDTAFKTSPYPRPSESISRSGNHTTHPYLYNRLVSLSSYRNGNESIHEPPTTSPASSPSPSSSGPNAIPSAPNLPHSLPSTPPTTAAIPLGCNGANYRRKNRSCESN